MPERFAPRGRATRGAIEGGRPGPGEASHWSQGSHGLNGDPVDNRGGPVPVGYAFNRVLPKPLAECPGYFRSSMPGILSIAD